MEFDNFYTDNYEKIYQFCYRILGDTQLAEDKTQEAFTKLLIQVKADKIPPNPTAWLYSVTMNSCRDHFRKHKNRNNALENLRVENNHINDSEKEYDKNEKIQCIRNALSKLSNRDRMLIQLSQNGLCYAEIAEAMHIRKSSVGKLLSRAIEKCAIFVRNEYK